jgi:glutaredoxin
MSNNKKKKDKIYIEAYVIEGCPYCSATINILEKQKIKFNKIIVPYHKKDEYKDKHQYYTFPHVFIHINKKKIFIGGYEDLTNLIKLCDFFKEKKITLEEIAEMCKHFV